MHIDHLLTEAQHLARPCTLLVPHAVAAPIAALWGGPGIVRPMDDSHRHRITIDGRFLPPDMHDLTVCLSLYATADEPIRYDPTTTLPTPSHAGIKLYPQRATSFPPLEALFRLGSPVIQEWLLVNHWQRDWEYTDTFPDGAVADAYHRIYQAQNPFYTAAAFAVLGGWHLPWPDGDWDDLLHQQLLLWTFKDAEPWIEVWRTNTHHFHLKERIT